MTDLVAGGVTSVPDHQEALAIERHVAVLPIAHDVVREVEVRCQTANGSVAPPVSTNTAISWNGVPSRK